MKNNLFGEKINYENIPPAFVLVGLLKRFDNYYQSAADSYFKETGWTQLYYLKGVTLFKQPPSIREMADFMGCSHQNANKLYARLVKDGYLSSVQDENDRRKQRLFLTEKGEKLLADTNFGRGKEVLEIFSVLSEEEIQRATEIIFKLIKQMDKTHFNRR